MDFTSQQRAGRASCRCAHIQEGHVIPHHITVKPHRYLGPCIIIETSFLQFVTPILKNKNIIRTQIEYIQYRNQTRNRRDDAVSSSSLSKPLNLIQVLASCVIKTKKWEITSAPFLPHLPKPLSPDTPPSNHLWVVEERVEEDPAKDGVIEGLSILLGQSFRRGRPHIEPQILPSKTGVLKMPGTHYLKSHSCLGENSNKM